MRQTTMLKPSEVVRQWYIVDGTDCTLGRLATQVATLLRGKHKRKHVFVYTGAEHPHAAQKPVELKVK